jgi:hypothetical protein
MQKWKRLLNLALLIIVFGSLSVMFLASDDPFARDDLCRLACVRSEHADALNKIAYDIAAGSLVSVIFYYLVVRLPDFLKRVRIKRFLSAQYRSFKIDCIAIFLELADGKYDGALRDELLTQAKFRGHFQNSRWSAVANGLQGLHLDDLVSRMEAFRDDVLFVLNNTDIGNDQSFEFFQRLSSILYERKRPTPDYDGIKALCHFLWELFSGRSFVDGYAKRDIVEDMIKAI